MPSTQACATCACHFGNTSDPLVEKPLLPGRELNCCGRSICSRCLNQNKRYETYCPYCQISTTPTTLPQGLRDPPPYSPHPHSISPSQSASQDEDELPAYSPDRSDRPPAEKQIEENSAPDVLHFLAPHDSIHSLALAYKVPLGALRKANNVFSDHLVRGRKTVIIPGEYYKGGVSLSPQPIEGEEEEARRNKTRRWMVACKVAEYDVALLYLKQAEWNLEAAIEAYREDEQWERDHPLEAKQKNKGKNAKNVGMRRFVGSSTGQSGTNTVSAKLTYDQFFHYREHKPEFKLSDREFITAKMLSRRMLSRDEEAAIGEEKEVRREDQEKINRFSRLHSRQKGLEDELKAKQKDKEDLEEISTELELADEDGKVPYKIGDSFFDLPVPEVQELLAASVERIDGEVNVVEDQLNELREEMQELKAALYGRFGRSINLEA